MLHKIKTWFEKPVRFDLIGQFLKPDINLLDIGCGDKAPYSTYLYYPEINYAGVDYHDIQGKSAMKAFYRCDLEGNDLHEIPDGIYDVIILSHIIEHIQNGEKLIEVLVRKLKQGGVIYIETPSEISLSLPSWYGTLNFYDDPTHRRLYSLKELSQILKRSGCTVIKASVRRSLKRIILSPIYMLSTVVRDKKINASSLWDITGFAHYVIARKD